MTAAVIVMLVATGAAGYFIGYRVAARKPTWRQRMRRPALARQAVTLVALMAASQVQRAVQQRISSGPRFLPTMWPPR